MEALMMTLPSETAFLVEIPFTTQPTVAVLHVPKSGDAWVYMPLVGMDMPQRINQLQWDGNAFEGQTALLVPGPAGGFYTLSGTVDADGSVHGMLERRGNTQPPSYDFTGARKR